MPLSHPGELAALATAFCWTVTALAFASAGRLVGSLAVNIIRLALGLVFLTIFCAATRGLPLPTDASPSAWLFLALSGVVGFLVGDLCLFRAFVVLGVRLSMLLMALVPPLTALLGFVALGEDLSAVDVAAMGLTVGGVAWVIMERRADGDGRIERPPLSGLLLGLGGALGQAGGLVLSKLGMRGYDPFAATQIRVIAGAAGFAILCTAVGWWPRVKEALAHAAAMKRITLGAFFGPFLGVSLSLAAVKYTEAGVAATIMAIVPVLVIPPSILIFKEKVTPRAVAGAVLAVAGVGLLFL
ncbi:MAG: DMT family transporter [Deltaproteobacteria bacterium]|nr:DMT family transporter [Deltaproteobacteria bacterium]